MTLKVIHLLTITWNGCLSWSSLEMFAKLKENNSNNGGKGQNWSCRATVARMACRCRFMSSVRHGTGFRRSCFSWFQRNGLVVTSVTPAAYHVTIQQGPFVKWVNIFFEVSTAFYDVCNDEKQQEIIIPKNLANKMWPKEKRLTSSIVPNFQHKEKFLIWTPCLNGHLYKRA